MDLLPLRLPDPEVSRGRWFHSRRGAVAARAGDDWGAAAKSAGKRTPGRVG